MKQIRLVTYNESSAAGPADNADEGAAAAAAADNDDGAAGAAGAAGALVGPAALFTMPGQDCPCIIS